MPALVTASRVSPTCGISWCATRVTSRWHRRLVFRRCCKDVVVGQFEQARLLGAGIFLSALCDARIVRELKIGLTLGPRNAGLAAVPGAIRPKQTYPTNDSWLGPLLVRWRQSLFAHCKSGGQKSEQNDDYASVHDGKLKSSPCSN